MNNRTKVILATVMMMAFPMSGLAYDGHGPVSKPCPLGVKQASGKHHGQYGHYAIPGKTSNYIRKILKRADTIGLSDRQRKQIGDLLVQAEVDTARARAEAQIAVAEFRSKLRSGNVSDHDVKAYSKRMGELRSDKLNANLTASVKASRLMSDEQKSRFYAGKKYQGSKK
jgi:hypothetical protein